MGGGGLILLCAFSSAFLMNIAEHRVTAVREVSHEDIRDAILSLVHMFRDNTDKLERHELRSRQLGEQLKKAFMLIEKKQKGEEENLNSVVEILTTMDKKLQQIEARVSGDELTKQREFMTSSIDALNTKVDNIEKRAQQNQEIIRSSLTSSSDLGEVINTNFENLNRNIASLKETTAIPAMVQNNIPDGLVETIEAKLSELQPMLSELHKSYAALLEVQQTSSDLVKSSADEIIRNVRSLPDKDYLSSLTNETIEVVNEAKYDILLNSEKGISRLQDKMSKFQEQFAEEQTNSMKSITDSLSTGEHLYADVLKSYEQLLKEIKGLSKIEQVLIQTADNVLDTKRRIEYGTHQILIEVGDLIKQQAKEMNATINQRFDLISDTILDNQNGALTNLSSKIETEISQVWRQIGIMYQTLTDSAVALDRLQHQTEIYVNGSLSTMDSMEGKVGQITGRMSEVDDNLNYLLGRLSLVTQEFNQIKTGLGEALDNIRSSFHAVQEKVKDVGPGPNPIAEEKEPDIKGLDFKNTQYTTN